MKEKNHSFEVGDRVRYRWPEPHEAIYPESYRGKVTNIYDTSNDVVVRWDDGDFEQKDADDLTREVQCQ